MTLREWADNGWLRPHSTSRKEIEGLFSIVDRDLKDATQEGISSDWRFGIAYNAALKLCTILLHASGYRAEKALQHYRSIQALPLVLGLDRQDDADYLDACRAKRNLAEYAIAGVATDRDTDELREFTKTLRKDVLDWLKETHSGLLPSQ